MTTSGEGAQAEIAGWFAGRLPADWYTSPPDVLVDRDEILVVGRLEEPELPAGSGEDTVAAARAARIDGFREDTRERRMRIAQEAQHRFGRHVSWGARCGDLARNFTTVSIPAMTRLRMDERKVLDTLVEAGVARSRSHALAWCVRLVASKQEEWLRDLREALTTVQKVRGEGPAA
ncbi:MAG TPA: hypothetical protein VFK59_05570 [Actinomycetota bacterium]|jgi:hypothetical protein|nr:hypothetical protein [Actinomycetota bacterium]